VARHLEAGGTLGSMPGYETRPGQLEMARAVACAFNGREHLMVEAGTGVGKSLAYLVPAVQWSFLNDTPVVLSTATRNLQSQLISSDLPRAARTLGDGAAKLRATVLKGRVNYLCLRMLGEYMQGGYWTLAEDERDAFGRFLEWLRGTGDGDLDDLGDEEMRARLSCPSEDCAGRACPFRAKCFVAKARARAREAHVVVVNHALVLADSDSSGSELLSAYGRIVFDEAHNLEDIATEFLSYELSRPALARLLGRLARTSRSRRGPSRPRGVLGAVERQLQRGAFPDRETAAEVREFLTKVHLQMRFVQSEGEALFAVLERLFSPAPNESVMRFRCVPQRQYSLRGIFADYSPAQWSEEELVRAGISFEDALARLQSCVLDLAEALVEASPGASHPDDPQALIKAAAESIKDFMLESKFVLAASDPSRAYWVERRPGNARARQGAYVRLVAAPLSVAADLKRRFYDVKDSVVLCSATLRAGDRFDYMARKLGVSLVEAGRMRSLVAASPFDYLRQACVLACGFLPDPSANAVEYGTALVNVLRDVFSATEGRGLVLFTAYEMMRAVAESVRAPLAEAGIDLFVQGDGLSREGMVAALKDGCATSAGKRARRVVLFGAQSFWEGVDVPGEALSCVVLARLPFPQVGEPIVEARSDRIKENGGSPFRDYMLPEAVIRFRQGFGRLVRTRRDRGVVVVTDPRVVTKNYGAVFRRAVPASVHSVSTAADLNARTTAFFGGG
jgi:ATP-dependent DNA helicase DinG